MVMYSIGEPVIFAMLLYTYTIAKPFSTHLIIFFSFVHGCAHSSKYRRLKPLRKYQAALVLRLHRGTLQRLIAKKNRN